MKISPKSREHAVNQYGDIAMTYYRSHLSTRYAELEDPDEHFRDLGEQIQDQVTDLTPQLAGPDQPDEGYLAKLGRLNAARNQAEEIVLKELLYSQKPENEPQDLDEETAASYRDLNQTIQDIHDLTRQTLDEPDPTTR
ncbi:TnpV protein [Kribbella sp. NPDC050124]|uniref:TnpV protein n=1 Tax=Kribbella sp. NPDC050124 TaxID=3364114 RepID=UPI0037ABAD0C